MDVYSKAIFTIIAVALCAIAVENAGSRARAQVQNVSKIAICSPEGFRCADVVGGSAFGGGRFTSALVFKFAPRRVIRYQIPIDVGSSTISPCDTSQDSAYPVLVLVRPAYELSAASL
jgi:hypothetical protein